MRVLVTGATGFVGSHVAAELVGRGDEVAVLRRAGGDAWRIAGLLPRVTTIAGDLSDVGASAGAIEAFAPEAVVHLAWAGVAKSRRDDREQMEANIDGSLALLRVAARAGCRAWVALGSQAEYGPQGRRLDESAPLAPRSLYGRAKVEACERSRRLAEGLGVRFAWLRLFSAYGPADGPATLVSYVIGALLRGDRPALTSGEQPWDFLYVGDAAEAIAATAAAPGAEGIYNLGSGRAVRVREAVEMIRDRIDPRLPLGFGEVPPGAEAPRHLEADIGRLAGATGWRPRTDLGDGLARTVDWFRRRARGAA